MYMKNCEMRDKNLEISQIHHKRKIYKTTLSILYTFFILSKSTVNHWKGLDFSMTFWRIYRFLAHEYDIHVLHKKI